MFLQKVYADKSLNILPDVRFEAPLNMRAVNLDCSTYEETDRMPLDSFGKSEKKRRVDDEFF
jgi:hypothetical protein